MKLTKFYTVLVASLVLVAACTNRLDLKPTNAYSADVIYANGKGYIGNAVKVYASLAVAGSGDPNSGTSTDIPATGDGGSSEFIRNLWNAQELPTDEAVNAWNDIGLPDYHTMTWTANNPWVRRCFARSSLIIAFANDFIRQAEPSKVAARRISSDTAAMIADFRNEVRYIRALQYYYLMDMFARPGFITDKDAVGIFPKQTSRKEMFAYIESELKDLENLLKEPRTAEYGRADKGAVWALLARMYLNSEVYTGEAQYANAAQYASKVINAGYSLHQSTISPNNSYREMFLADNSLTCRDEFIFTVNYDGTKTQTYGGTTYLGHSAAPNVRTLRADFGFTNAWLGNRTTKAFSDIMADTNDQRARLIYRTNQTPLVTNVSDFTQGYLVTKFRNVTSTGVAGSDPTSTFFDTDFPLFRLSEMYLIYAEAAAKGAADAGIALGYMNQIRARAYGTNPAPTLTTLTLEDVQTERARELYWECHRRTDLIRWGKFTQNTYIWEFKGGAADGTTPVDITRNVYPIPGNELFANPNLKQNDGY